MKADELAAIVLTVIGGAARDRGRPDEPRVQRITHHCDILETGNDSFRFKQRKKQPKPA